MLPGHQLVRELCESIIPALMVSNQGKFCISPDKGSLCTYKYTPGTKYIGGI